MKKVVLGLLLILTISTSAYAGFFTDVLSGATANALTGSSKGYKDDGSAKSYFIILNKKINSLDLQVKILLGTNAISFILLIWIFFRQKKHLLLEQTYKQCNNSKGENENEKFN